MAMVGRCRLQLRQQLLLRIWGAWWSQAAQARLQMLGGAAGRELGSLPISRWTPWIWCNISMATSWGMSQFMKMGKTTQSVAFGRSKWEIIGQRLWKIKGLVQCCDRRGWWFQNAHSTILFNYWFNHYSCSVPCYSCYSVPRSRPLTWMKYGYCEGITHSTSHSAMTCQVGWVPAELHWQLEHRDERSDHLGAVTRLRIFTSFPQISPGIIFRNISSRYCGSRQRASKPAS